LRNRNLTSEHIGLTERDYQAELGIGNAEISESF
jgi:hypothetical protein